MADIRDDLLVAVEMWKARAEEAERALLIGSQVNDALRAEVERLSAFLVRLGYHAPAGAGGCYHGMAHWVGGHCAFDCAALASPETADPEDR